jgi:hypothetical protein
MKKIVTAIFAIAVLVSESGCATLGDARAAKGTGAARRYNASQETIWKAVPQVLTELGLQFVSDNKQEGYVLAQRGITAFSYGENVAIFIEASGDAHARVEVVSKKTMATNVFAPSWENDILNKLDEKLKEFPLAKSEAQKTKEFIVVGYSSLLNDLRAGKGPYLTSLLSMLQIRQENGDEATKKIRALSEVYTNIPEFADHVVNLFIRQPATSF